MAIEPAETEPAEIQPRWGLGDAAIGFLVGLVLSSVAASVVLAGQSDPDELTIGGQAVSQLALWVGLAGSAILAARLKGAGKLSQDFGLRVETRDVPIGIAAGLFAQLVIIRLVDLALSPVLDNPEVSGPVEELLDKASGPAIVVLFLFVVVGAPIVEELFFRGLLLRSLLRKMSPAWAIAISGALFGIAHPQDVSAEALVLIMVSLAAFGAFLAYLAHRYGRLGPSIVAHAVFNAFTLTVLLAT